MTVYLTIREKETGSPGRNKGRNKGRKNDAFFEGKAESKREGRYCLREGLFRKVQFLNCNIDYYLHIESKKAPGHEQS